MNSGSEDYSSSDGFRRRKTGVATLRLSSTSQGTLRLSQDGRKKKRDFDSAVDDDFTLTGSLSRSMQLPTKAGRPLQQRNSLSSTRSSHQTPRYSSASDDDVEPDDDPEADEKSDRRGSLQYTRDSLSVRGFDETIDSNPGNSVGRSSVSSRPRYGGHGDDSGDDDDLQSAFNLTNDEYLADTNTHSAGTYTSDMSKDQEPIDFNQTIVTDISGPGDDIEERANAYERSARESVKQAPRTPQNMSAGGRPIMTASSRGTASPFDAMASDFDDDGSLELSQSNDVFGNMMEPPRSARLREEK
jgi:hypothetical protein